MAALPTLQTDASPFAASDGKGRREGIRQVIDEKNYKPGLGAYDRKKTKTGG